MKKTTLNQWFFVHSFLPIILVISISLFLTMAIFLYSSIQRLGTTNTYIEKTSQNLSLAILQKNRPQIENIVSTLKNSPEISSVAVCKKNTIYFGTDYSSNICQSKSILSRHFSLSSEKDLHLSIRFANPLTAFSFKITFSIIIITIILTFYVLKRFKEKFQNDLINGILHIESENFRTHIVEIDKLSVDLKNTQLLKIQLEKEKSLNLFSLQIYHDIRSPLSLLKHSLYNDSKSLDNSIPLKAIDRISSIVEGLLRSSKQSSTSSQPHKDNTQLKTEEVQALKFVEQIIDEKKIEYQKLDLISIELSTENISKSDLIKLNTIETSRVISNLINNSVEAMNHKGIVIVKLFKSHNKLNISIFDNGGGMPNEVLSQLGKSTITTKTNGHGLGLFHAINSIHNQNASIKFVNINNGLEVTLTFEISTKDDPNYVLIENDELTRMIWQNTAKNKGLKLFTCKDINDFEKIKNLVNTETHFYIDSELDDQIKGEDFAKSLFDEGFLNLYLSTGHHPSKFSDHHYLKNIISKAPPF